MGAYKAAVITDAGQNLIAQALAEHKTVVFTKTRTSSYAYPEGTNILGLTELRDVVQEAAPFNSRVYNGKLVQVSSRFDNDQVLQKYRIETIGLYARIEGEQEILFSVSQATVPDEMPVHSDVSPSAFIYNIQYTVQNASQIAVTVNPSGTATVQDVLDLQNPQFDDSGEAAGITGFPSFLATLKSRMDVFSFYRNLKAGLKYVPHLGDIVNNCTSTDTDKPLAAAQGKTLWDKIVDVVAALTAHKASGDHDGRYYTETEMDGKLAGKSDTGHTHDGRYYTESEMDGKLAGKSDTSHGHSGMLTTGDIVDNCTSTATNKPLSAKQGKTLWDKIVDAVSALATHKSSGDHDGRYYTESEMNSKLSGKSDTGHNHDSTYVKQNNVAEVSGIRVGDKATSGYGWIDIYYHGMHCFAIYAESLHKLVIKPVNTINNGNDYYVDIAWHIKQNGVPVLTMGDLVDNCTSDSTNKAPTAKQAKLLMDKYNQLNSDKLDKSSSQQLVTNQNFSITENFKQITTNSKIPNSGYLQFIFGVGMERYSVLFDPVRNIIQPFYIGQSADYNFYLKLRIDSDTKVSVSVNSLKGYTLSDFANKPIWMRTYYAN